MTLSRKLLLFAAAVVLVMICVPASADTIIAQQTSHITGTGGIADIQCDATVTRGLDGWFTYDYLLTYLTGTATVKTHRVQNPNHVAYSDAANTPVTGQFINPVWTGAPADTWISWTNGILLPGGARTFSYRSQYAPMLDVFVWEIVIDGGSSATGKTIGMSNVIPEPSSMAALLIGFVGFAPLVIKRRK